MRNKYGIYPFMESLGWEWLETQRIANRRISSVFGIPSIPNTRQYLGVMKSQKLAQCGINMEYIPYWESLGWEWLETQRISNRRISSVFGISSIPNTGQ